MLATPARTTRRSRILIIDDDPQLRDLVAGCIASSGFVIMQAPTASEGLRQIEDWHPDVVLLDQQLPDRRGVEVIGEIASIDRQLPILFITSSASSQTAIEATRRGAFDFLAKPLALPRLSRQILQAIESRRLLHRPVVLQAASTARDQDTDVLIGRSDAMLEVYKAIGRVAANQTSALIIGEPGSGKELVARAIHQHGSRADLPLLVVNCSDFGPIDLESLLFGLDEDSLIKRASGGTLLLEEVSAIAPGTQFKLLKLLRDQLSDSSPKPSILFTSVCRPEALLSNRQLRTDLYYELNGAVVSIPPLRERKGDLPLLVEYYLERFARVRAVDQTEIPRVSDQALTLLLDYQWPGNVAELKSVLRRALQETRGTIIASEYLHHAVGSEARIRVTDTQSNGDPITTATTDQVGDWRFWMPFVEALAGQEDPRLYLKAIELLDQGIMRAVLKHTQGNVSHAARILGITRVSLRKKARRWLLASEHEEPDGD